MRYAIIKTGSNRLRPIVMTALTTILGLVPMALGMGMGADMAQPMALVVIGGLIYGTLLTLVVVPCIYEMFNKNKKSPMDEEMEMEAIEQEMIQNEAILVETEGVLATAETVKSDAASQDNII